MSTSTEALPFIVRLLSTYEERLSVVHLRAEAYARHVGRHYPPEFIESLRQFDADDAESAFLAAYDKEDNSLIGSLRMRSSLTSGVALYPPGWWGELGDASFLYTDRVSVSSDATADLVSLALIKGQWFHAYHEHVQWMTGIATPAWSRRYRQVGLRVLNDKKRFIVPAAPEKEYLAMGAPMSELPVNLLRVRPAFAPFMFDIQHPDILLPRPALLDEHVAQAREFLAAEQRKAA